MKSLLMMAPFRDPDGPRLGIGSPQAALEHRGRDAAIFYFGNDARVRHACGACFDAPVPVVPDMRTYRGD